MTSYAFAAGVFAVLLFWAGTDNSIPSGGAAIVADGGDTEWSQPVTLAVATWWWDSSGPDYEVALSGTAKEAGRLTLHVSGDIVQDLKSCSSKTDQRLDQTRSSHYTPYVKAGPTREWSIRVAAGDQATIDCDFGEQHAVVEDGGSAWIYVPPVFMHASSGGTCRNILYNDELWGSGRHSILCHTTATDGPFPQVINTSTGRQSFDYYPGDIVNLVSPAAAAQRAQDAWVATALTGAAFVLLAPAVSWFGDVARWSLTGRRKKRRRWRSQPRRRT